MKTKDAKSPVASTSCPVTGLSKHRYIVDLYVYNGCEYFQLLIKVSLQSSNETFNRLLVKLFATVARIVWIYCLDVAIRAGAATMANTRGFPSPN